MFVSLCRRKIAMDGLSGRPYVGDLDICAEMVRMGAAWAYREYLIDKSLLTLESDAKAAERGLWGLSEAKNMPPWEWRREGNQEASSGRLQYQGQHQHQGRPHLSCARK